MRDASRVLTAFVVFQAVSAFGVAAGAQSTTGASGAGAEPPPLVNEPSAGSGAAGAGAGAGASAGVGDSSYPAGSGAAGAGTPAGANGSTATTPARPPWSHRNQLSIRVAGSEGYTLGIRYGDGDTCNAHGDIFCPQRSPVMVDTALGFGVADTLEIEARFRFGEPGWNQAIPLAAGVGLRVYGNSESRLKFFFGVAGLADFTARGTASQYGTDILVRAEEGIHYDVARYFGFYFQFGETFGVLRAFSLTVDGGLGVQVRLP
jgi:hypothetical protein